MCYLDCGKGRNKAPEAWAWDIGNGNLIVGKAGEDVLIGDYRACFWDGMTARRLTWTRFWRRTRRWFFTIPGPSTAMVTSSVVGTYPSSPFPFRSRANGSQIVSNRRCAVTEACSFTVEGCVGRWDAGCLGRIAKIRPASRVDRRFGHRQVVTITWPTVNEGIRT